MSFRKWACSDVKHVLKFNITMGRAVSVLRLGPRRKFRRNDLAPSAATRCVPVADVESEKVAVTEVEVVEMDVNFFSYYKSLASEAVRRTRRNVPGYLCRD